MKRYWERKTKKFSSNKNFNRKFQINHKGPNQHINKKQKKRNLFRKVGNDFNRQKIIYKSNKKIKNFKENLYHDSDEIDLIDNDISDIDEIKINHKKQEQISSKIPWISIITKETIGMVKLHNEISEFYQYITPNSEDHKSRIETFKLFRKIIKSKWSSWEVKLFGSFPLKTHLPDSDIDLIVFKQTDLAEGKFNEYMTDALLTENKQLHYIQSILIETNFCDEINYVDARVPLIRCKCRKTQIRMDITANRENGRESLKKFKNIMSQYPLIRPLVVLLKFILRQRNLNETYTGGVGSYLLLNLVYAYVQHLIRTNEEDKILNVGKLFIGFLKFYGEEFNYRELGISITDGGEFFRKWHRNFSNNEGICLENYQDPNQDIGKGAYNYSRISLLFRELLHTLYKVKNSSESYLASIINVTVEIKRYSYKNYNQYNVNF